nr:4-hydroxythreonine-4-phosphate dehydrogenase PdxA [uncultured Holophaga sp.]
MEIPERPRLAITLGDPCGISPELLLKSLPQLCAMAEIRVFGARAGLELLEGNDRVVPGASWSWEAATTSSIPGASVGTLCFQPARGMSPLRIPWIDPTPGIGAQDLELGRGSAASGRCAVLAVKLAAERILAGDAQAMVTLPLAKAAAHQAGFPIPGHTEFLQELTGAPLIRMGFLSPTLNVVLHTVHQSLRSVVEGLDADAVAETLAFAADRYAQLSGDMSPRVALCALNPHAGEGGAFGDEEDALKEALIKARHAFRKQDGSLAAPFASLPSPFPPGPAPQGWALYPDRVRPDSRAPSPDPDFQGPFPSDTLFLRALRGEFDLVVALYHDQGLIPIKVLEPDRAVNITLGLPFIRTSPDHGTAFGIAGEGVASPADFLEAASLAVRLARRSSPPS